MIVSCGGDSPQQPNPVASASPAPAPTPTATPTPAPTAVPTPDPENRPPTVSAESGGNCHPNPDRPCSVLFKASAADPDGDRLTYNWNGCAEGTGRELICLVQSPGIVTATVRVRDGRGGVARASAEAHGVNQAPLRVRLGYPRPPNPCPGQHPLPGQRGPARGSGQGRGAQPPLPDGHHRLLGPMPARVGRVWRGGRCLRRGRNDHGRAGDLRGGGASCRPLGRRGHRPDLLRRAALTAPPVRAKREWWVRELALRHLRFLCSQLQARAARTPAHVFSVYPSANVSSSRRPGSPDWRTSSRRWPPLRRMRRWPERPVNPPPSKP